jgi:bifunctional enzyme CysN/CysC
MIIPEADLLPQAAVGRNPAVSSRPILRLVTCGSVDDGKSTLIGRLLYEKQLIPADQLTALQRDSRKFGTVGEDIDFALLVDGLEAEREQGITIDVAYRYFSTSARSFIVADSPGHEQYTRNMVTAASNADLAIILVDARKGLLAQTFRHSIIASLLGIRYVVLAVNKIDLVDYAEHAFRTITTGYERFAEPLGFASVVAIPISARFGDNVSSWSERTVWYRGPHLLSYLERVNLDHVPSSRPFRMMVQWVNRPNLDFRAIAGTIASGKLHRGDEIVVAEVGRTSRVERIVTADGDLDAATAGEAVALVLADEIDVARGSVLAHPTERPQVLDQFAAHLVWMGDDPLIPGRSYLMKIGTRSVPATVIELKHRLDINTLVKLAAKTLRLNDIGLCNLATMSPIAFDPYAENRETGAFILIDRSSNATVGAGLISFGLRRATNVHLQQLSVSREARARIKHQRPAVLWFTGLSGAGKSTVANLVEARLNALGVHTFMLDGDNVRHGLNKDLGFTEADRVENIRRIGEVAKLMTDAGLIVLCSFISPFLAERQLVRQMTGLDAFIEIFVDAPLDICIARDAKGLYERALAGEIKNFTGVDQAYEAPEDPELHLDAAQTPPDLLARRILDELVNRGIYDIGVTVAP